MRRGRACLGAIVVAAEDAWAAAGPARTRLRRWEAAGCAGLAALRLTHLQTWLQSPGQRDRYGTPEVLCAHRPTRSPFSESHAGAPFPPCSGRLAWGTQRRRAPVRRDGAGTALTLRSAGLSVWALQKKQGTGLKGKSPGKVQDGCGCSDGLRACAPVLRGARGLCVRVRGRSAGLGRRVWTAEGAGDARGSLASGPDGLVPRGRPATQLRGRQSPPH